jgi:hypothetical protein
VIVTGLALAGPQAGDYQLAAGGAAAPVGVVAYWRFEEGTADQPANVAGSIMDSSGNGLDGTPIGGPVYSADVAGATIPQTGAANNLSLDFNGQNQRIAIPDSPLFQLTHSLTLEAYIKLSAIHGGEEQIVFRGDDRPGLDPYMLEIRDGNLAFRIEDASDDEVAVSVPFAAYVGQWVHVAGTLDDATGKMSLYINGTLVASGTTAVRPLGPLTGPLPGVGIGNVQSGNYGEYFPGLIDEVRISSQALTPDQFLDESTGSVLTLTANITPKPLTVTGITASDKRYDGTTAATLTTSGAALGGVLSGDTVTLDTSAATGTFANPGPGNNVAVTVSGLALGGAQAADYTVVPPTLTANILPALPRALVNSYNSLEGTSGLTPFVFQIRLATPARIQTTYDFYTTDGTAVAGVNYVGITAGDSAHGGVVTFLPGSAFGTVTVYVITGSLPVTPATERANFFVHLSDPLAPDVPIATGVGTITAQNAIPSVLPPIAAQRHNGIPWSRFLLGAKWKRDELGE